jgi:signal transduction histidine kinase
MEEETEMPPYAAHEIRTALTSIQGFSELLRDMDLTDEERRDFADIINLEAVRLMRLISRLLDI